MSSGRDDSPAVEGRDRAAGGRGGRAGGPDLTGDAAGAEFSLIDTAFGPLFQRLDLLQSAHAFLPWENYPKTRKWADTLLAMEVITGAVPEDFQPRYKGFLKMQGGYGAELFAA